MATLTKNTAVGPSWTDITTALGIADDEKWGFECVGESWIEFAETDSSAAPAAGLRGQMLYPPRPGRGGTQLIWTRATGRYLWARSNSGSMTIVAAVA